MSLSLKLLGEFAIRDASGMALSLPTRKTRALLGYLAVNADRPQPRERLMELLWSDRSERQARHSLNQSLVEIRRLSEANGTALLDSDGERVTLRGDAVVSDVHCLRSLIRNNPAKAAALYDGPFLDGLSVPDPGFENWLLATRSELHLLACDALETAAKSTEDTTTAINCVRRLLALDPLREDAHRRLMWLLYQSGDRAAALRQYKACADLLERELQVEPNAATKSLLAEIRQDAGAVTKTFPPTGDRDASSFADKPSIAVLPFDNLGDDPIADHLARGLTEDLTAALAKVPELLVIARNSSAIYKGRAVKVQEIAETLGIKYVLEGTVQKTADRLRITPQLIDATTGYHLWAERYDRPIEDVFALQDEIVRNVLIELQVRFTEGEGVRIASRATNNLEAWLYWIQGHAELRKYTRERTVRARELFHAACRADPNWARPVAGIAISHKNDARYGWTASREESIALGMEYAELAITMDPDDSYGYVALRDMYVHLLGDQEKGLSFIEKAVSLSPSDQSAVGRLADTLLYLEDFDAAIEAFERMVRLGPIVQKQYRRLFGLALQLTGRKERAVSVLEELARQEPEWSEGLAQLSAAYADVGRFDAAHATTETILEHDPSFTASRYLALVPFRNAKHTEWLRALLAKTGLPE